jgi:lipopolysaccharide/colanic/teichoic acid biosynthesis glycosyltransferase
MRPTTATPETCASLYRIIKRALDLLIAGLGLIAISPLLLLSALIIFLLEGKPILYRSIRHLSPTRAVSIFKFRTMIHDATNPRHKLHERFMRDGYLDIPLTCEVFTPVGRVLERLQIVELPQLFNILFSGMSFIGNRPLPFGNLQILSKNFPDWMERFGSPCGITGISQVVGKHYLEPHERLALESAYCRVYMHGNVLKCDALIILATLKLVISGKPTTVDDAWRLLASSCNEKSLIAAVSQPLTKTVSAGRS